MSESARMLAAALLWARNHLDVTEDRAVKDKVIERIDRVLKHREPTALEMQRFRDVYGDRPAPKRRTA